MANDLNHKLLLAYGDGELSEDEARRVEELLERDPALRSRLEAERQLKQRVGALMRQSSDVPAGLAGQIKAQWREQAHAEPAPAAPARAAAPARTAQPTNPLTAVMEWFNRPRRVSVAAVLATLVIVAAAIIIGIFGTTVDQRADPEVRPTNYLPQAAEHVSAEHDRCTENAEALLAKAAVRTEEDAIEHLRTLLGVADVTVFDLSKFGYEFVGEGACHLPGTNRSAHLIYERNVPGEPRNRLSIFVAPDEGQYEGPCRSGPIREGRWSQITTGPKCSKTILRGKDDSLIYFIVSREVAHVRPIARDLCHALDRRGR